MVLFQEAIMEMQFKRLIKKKIELSLCKMEEELRKELNNKDSNSIEIKFGQNEELSEYIIKINNKQVTFTLEDITKALTTNNKDMTEYIDGYKRA